MPSLLLQKPNKMSKAKEHNECLKRRLDLWHEGDFDKLVREVRFIQNKLKDIPFTNIEPISKKFNDFLLTGNVNSAMRLLSKNNNGGLLPINNETVKLLKEKHPEAVDVCDDMLLEGPEILVENYCFNDINANLIQKAALHTKGAA